MDDDVALVGEQRLTQCSGEDTGPAQFGQRLARRVAVRRDRDEHHVFARRPRDRLGDDRGLGDGEGTPPGSQAEQALTGLHRGGRATHRSGHGASPAAAGLKPRRVFSQQPGRHTSYQGPRPVTAGR